MLGFLWLCPYVLLLSFDFSPLLSWEGGKREEQQRFRAPQTPTWGEQCYGWVLPATPPHPPLWAQPAPLCQPLLMVPDFSITRPFQGPSIRQFASQPSPCTGTHQHLSARVWACLAAIHEEGMERETKNTHGIPARSHMHSSQHWSKEIIPSTGKHSHTEKPLTLLPELSAEFSMFILPENSLPPSSSSQGWIFPSQNHPLFYPEQIK